MFSQPTFDAMFSIAMAVAIGLIWGGIVLIRRGTDRTRGILMLVAALVLLGNVLIWTLPG